MSTFFQGLEDFDAGLGFIGSNTSRCPQSVDCQTSPASSSGLAFFSPDIRPQCIQLPTLDFEITHQHRFHLLGMPCRFSKPFQNRIFFVPFGARQTADAIALG